MKRSIKIGRNVLIGIVVFYLALFGFTKAIRYPEPIAAVRLGLAPASKTPDLMPAHVIEPAAMPIPFANGVQEMMPEFVSFQGVSTPWKKFLTDTNTNGLLILRNGVITHEWYASGFEAQTRFPSYSVAKTMTSILIGQLIDEGRISESDPFVKYFPEFANGTAFDRVTIRTLLDMQGGVGVKDNYPEGPSGWGVAIAQMYATTDIHWFMGNNRKMAFEPGTDAEYRSVDTQMLGMIITKVTGKHVADLFSERVWKPVGAEFPATWNVDRVGGQEKTFCCFNASVRDYGRVGQMLLNQGMVGSDRIVSQAWITRMTTPVVTLDHGWGYGAQTWHPYPGITMLLGLHGQFVFINPQTRTVIVKVSDNPTGADKEEATAAVLYEISKNPAQK